MMTLEEYLQDLPLLHIWEKGKTLSTGGFDAQLLRKLFNFLASKLPPRPMLLETGAGNSTITMLFLEPTKIMSIAPDAELFQRIRAFCAKHQIADTAIEAHIDGSQWVLPTLAASNRQSEPYLDFALIDGCHGWPTAFTDLEYVNVMLREGGYLMIDDVQLHAEKEIARLLAEHKAFSLELDLGKSLVFRKILPDRFLGEWVDQPYIVRRTNEYGKWSNPYSLQEVPPANGGPLRAVARRLRRLMRI
jgi:predicted O-methyltransferase YrrM